MTRIRKFLKRLYPFSYSQTSPKRRKLSHIADLKTGNSNDYLSEYCIKRNIRSVNLNPPQFDSLTFRSKQETNTSANASGRLVTAAFYPQTSDFFTKKVEVTIPNYPDNVLQKKRKILMIGDGNCGQLGLGDTVTMAHDLKMLQGVDSVMDVCAGGMHTIYLTSTGQVFSFGCNDDGALGRVTEEELDCFTPHPITSLESHHVVNISAGDSHSSAVTDQGLLFIWGTFRRENGGCRLTSTLKKSCIPVQMPLPCRVKKVQSGNNHLLVLTQDGDVLSMGTGERGQLGRIPETYKNPEDHFLFELKTVFNNIIDGNSYCDEWGDVKMNEIWAGNNSSFARDNLNNIYAWGLNNYHQLGFTDNICRHLVVQWDFSPRIQVEQISAGDHHTLLLDKEGNVYSIGKGHYGQLGHGRIENNISQGLPQHDRIYKNKSEGKMNHAIFQFEVSTFTKVEDLTLTSHVMAGLSVSFAVSKNGRLYRWGQESSQLGSTQKNEIGEYVGDVGDDNDHDDTKTGKDIFIPELIESDSTVLKVSSNGLHTAVLICAPTMPIEDNFVQHMHT